MGGVFYWLKSFGSLSDLQADSADCRETFDLLKATQASDCRERSEDMEQNSGGT
jgi:hypothetical protein